MFENFYDLLPKQLGLQISAKGWGEEPPEQRLPSSPWRPPHRRTWLCTGGSCDPVGDPVLVQDSPWQNPEEKSGVKLSPTRKEMILDLLLLLIILL